MIDFGEDSRNGKVVPYISNEIIKILSSLSKACFFDVARYRYDVVFGDFEIMTAVCYSDVLQNTKMERIAERLTENAQQYNAGELTFLTIRHLMHYSWKLDTAFLLHLEDCLNANALWNKIIRTVSMMGECINNQPYWLRNEQAALIQGADSEFIEILKKIDFVMIKSNTIFPKCSLLGAGQKAHYFIHMDSGIYSFLYEWILIVLSGYRINQFNLNKKFMRISEPFRTGAQLMLAVADIIRGHRSAYDIPVATFTFSQNDYHIAKEVVTRQIGFLLRHECGHIYASEKNMSMKDKEEEIFADEFAIDLLIKSGETIVLLNGEKEAIINDIQSELDKNRCIEDIELLFIFYDMYFFASEILGYKNEDDCSHPHSYDRRLSLKQKYPDNKQINLLDYAEIFADRVKEEMRKNERN